ncbi:MAG TPA: YbaK/EbsC family protein [Actinomycetales bacterium]|nr:YbaK/EbsC family protein [Actinomycetales bacterium]
MSPEERGLAAAVASGLAHRVVRHGKVSSAREAAVARGVEESGLIKTLVVRRADDDYLFVLVPADREISWPKLRAALGVSRLSMPDAATALAVTGYERGTITPFGATHPWPVVADSSVADGAVALGGGGHGVALVAEWDDVVRILGAQVADVTDPAR